jgi:protein phosphatase
LKKSQGLKWNSNRLAVAIVKAKERVMAAVAAQPWLKGMGTTVVAGLLNEKILSLAHVGDSRAYLYRQGELTLLTDDHSWVQEQVSAGILTEEEAKTHPLKNVVTRAPAAGPSRPRICARWSPHRATRSSWLDGLTTMLRRRDPRRGVSGREMAASR